MSEFCKKCLESLEPEATPHDLAPVPEGCCVVCWVRYGKYIQACTTLGELAKNED